MDKDFAVAAVSSAVDVLSDSGVFNISGTPAAVGVPSVAGVSGTAVVGSLLLLAYLSC